MTPHHPDRRQALRYRARSHKCKRQTNPTQASASSCVDVFALSRCVESFHPQGSHVKTHCASIGASLRRSSWDRTARRGRKTDRPAFDQCLSSFRRRIRLLKHQRFPIGSESWHKPRHVANQDRLSKDACAPSIKINIPIRLTSA